MRKNIFRQRPLLTIPQILILLSVIAALFIGLDLTRRAQAGRLVGIGEESLNQQISLEATRQIELQATRAYVQSDEHVAAYARNEGGFILPGEKRIVPMISEATPGPPPSAPPTPDPALNARPWQAWWRLVSDNPLPATP
jgi:hypothetical protein